MPDFAGCEFSKNASIGPFSTVSLGGKEETMKATIDKANQGRSSADRVFQHPTMQDASLESLEVGGHRSEALSQRKLQEKVDNSPRARAQATWQEAINNSHQMVARRQQVKRWFGAGQAGG
jgi:hypothetical protein